MARLVITPDHLERACVQMELTEANKNLFGGRIWEDEICSQHQWTWIEFMEQFGNSRNFAEARRVLTLVYGTIVEARAGTLPNLIQDGYLATVAGYLTKEESVPTEDILKMLLHDTVTSLTKHQAPFPWAELFRSELSHAKLSTRDKFRVCGFTLLVSQAQWDESKPDTSAGDDPTFFLADEDEIKPNRPSAEKTKKMKKRAIEPVLDTHVTFADIGGFPLIKSEGEQLAKMLNQPDVLASCGLEAPRGVLLVGPPGTGKTLWARALASAVKKPFYEVSQAAISTCWINMSGQMLGDLFAQVKADGGGIIFFDEAESLLIPRGGRQSHAEDTKVVSEFNRNMQRPTVPDGIIVLLAINLENIVDEASIRAGRIDRIIRFALPADDDRRQVIDVHMDTAEKRAGKKLFERPLGKEVIGLTKGFSCAELGEVVRRSLVPKGNDMLNGKPFALVTTDDFKAAITEISVERNKKSANRTIGF